MLPTPHGATKKLDWSNALPSSQKESIRIFRASRPDADTIDESWFALPRRSDRRHSLSPNRNKGTVFTWSLDQDSHTKDGIGGDLFPLSTEQQKREFVPVYGRARCSKDEAPITSASDQR